MPEVLVVDDDAPIRTIVRTILEFAGFTVREAVDGVDALRQIGDAIPDAVVSDVHMPGMDGFELLERLQLMGLGSKMRITLLTGTSDPDETRRGWALGVDACLPKPFEPDALVQTLQELIECPDDQRVILKSNYVDKTLRMSRRPEPDPA